MKQSLLAIGCLALLNTYAAEPFAGFDAEKLNALPAEWTWHQPSNPKPPCELKQDQSGKFLAFRETRDFYSAKLYPVREFDTIRIQFRARSKNGTARIGNILFSSASVRGSAAEVILTPEWKEYSIEAALPVHTVKNAPVYYYRVRPLIAAKQGTQWDLASIRYTMNPFPLLREWELDRSRSTGALKGIRTPETYAVLPGKIFYTHSQSQKAAAGDQLVFRFKIRGKGTLRYGCGIYDAKSKPGRPAAEITKEETIDSPAWKTVNISIPLTNPEKDGKTVYIKTIVPFFSTESAAGNALELAEITCKTETEKLGVPEF